jgi:hypothetical protein
MSTSADRQLAAADARRLAAARAARAAASSRRAAAARRRLALTALLLVATVAAWVGYTMLSWPIAGGVATTAVLVGVVVLGRRAAAAGDAADARWEREVTSITANARTRVATAARAAGKPQLRVDVDPAALIDESAQPPVVAPVGRPVAEAGALGWTPVPVPPPAYTLKQSAPRRSVSPLVMDAPTEQMDAVETVTDAVEDVSQEQPAAATTEPAMDLQAVLARRRAVG